MIRLTVILLLISFSSFSQKLIFCEQVTNEGNPVSASNEFSIGPKGGFFKILVKLNKQTESRNIVFDFYIMKEGKEVFDNSLKMDIKPGLSWFFKEVTLYKPGQYHVYVYDDKDQLLGVGEVSVQLK